MARRDDFADYLVDLLRPLGLVQPRRMFGGYGLFFGGRMFGIVINEQLYLKTDEVTRADFEAEGCRPFIYQARGREQAMSYWTPPADVEDNARLLLPWARRAVDASNRVAAKKPAAKKKAPVEKAPAERKAPAKKAPAEKKPAAKQASTTRKTPAKKAAAKKVPAKPRVRRS